MEACADSRQEGGKQLGGPSSLALSSGQFYPGDDHIMTAGPDLIIRRAKISGCSKNQDIAIAGGIIRQVADKIAESSGVEIDAGGNLTIPPFVDPHLHLDSVLTAGYPRHNISGTLSEAIAIWSERKAKLTDADVKRRALEAIKWSVVQGTLFIRTHVDICEPGLTALKAMIEIKERVKSFAELQIVAFPQDGIVKYPGGAELMDLALSMGADVVGGTPHCEWTREDGLKSLDIVFELAQRHQKNIDVHIDETDDDHSRFTEYLASKKIRESFSGSVTASHTTAMHSYNNAYASKIIELIRASGLHVITNPLDNISLQGRFDTYPKRRGLTRVKELMDAGVNVGIGHDSIMDPFYPLGKGSMLEAGFMCLNVAHMTGYREMQQIFDALTYNSARIMDIDGYGTAEGSRANLVVLNAGSEIDALRLGAEALYVIKNGKIVAQTEPAKRRFYKEEVRLSASGLHDRDSEGSGLRQTGPCKK